MKTTDKDSNIKPTNDAVESEKLVNKPAEQQPVLESGVEFSQETADVAAGEQLDLALPESQIVAMADNAEDKESKRKDKKEDLEQDAEQVAQSAEEQVVDLEQSDAAGEDADGNSEVQGEVAEALAEQSAAKGFGVYLSQLSTQTLVLGSLGILGAATYYRNRDDGEESLKITSGDTAEAIDENSGSTQIIYTTTVNLSEGITFSLSGNSDSALSINSATGAVTLSADPDAEAQGQYAFTVIATDAEGNRVEQAVALNINNLDEVAPTITSGDTATAIDENSGSDQVVYTATADDSADASGGVTFSLSEDSDSALSIDSATGAVTLSADPDAETQDQYSFTVVATDAAGNSSEQAVTLDINDIDDAVPTITSGATADAIDENSGAAQVIYTATVDDSADISGGVTFSLSEDSDAALSIDSATGAVTLSDDPDAETQSQYTFTVVATDAAGNSSEQAVALNINNLDEVAPTITSGATAATIDENSGASQVVYTATADDSADASSGVTFSLSDDSDSVLSIDSATGAVILSVDPDAETQSQYTFTVVATDAAGNSSEQAVALNINNLDEVAPTVTSDASATAIDENSGAGQVIYTATADDSADVSVGVSFSLADDTLGFSIDANTGVVTTNTDFAADYEDAQSQSFTVVATDASGNSTQKVVNVAINNLDEIAPTITSGETANAIDENSGAGQIIYTATADDSADVSDGFSLSLADDTLGFSIDANTGVVTTNADFAADYEDSQSQSFTVVATDAAGNSSQKVVIVAINNLDEIAPTITSGEAANAIDENSGAGQVVYTAEVDDSADVSVGVSFSLADDTLGFSIDTNTGIVTTNADFAADYEDSQSQSFTVVATDDAGNSSQKVVNVAINNLDEIAPTITSGETANAIDENSGAGQVIYTATADDSADISGGVTFSLSEDSDAALSIDASTGEVTLTTDPDFEAQEQYSFSVIATDSAGNASDTQSVTLNINDLDDFAPELVGITYNNEEISANFNEALDSSAPLPSVSDFVITQGGQELAISSISINGSSVLLSVPGLTEAALQVSYTPSSNPIQDLAGNPAAGFTQMVVSDGYIRDAKVYADTNNDGIADESELIEGVTSDSLGQLVISGDYADEQIIIKGGVNVDTGAINQLELTAPAGYSVINPLSTLVQEIIASDETQTLDVDQAETVLSEALGITLGEGEDLSSYDPISDVSENAVANRVATIQIATVLAVAAAADQADASGESNIEAVALENLVEIVKSSTEQVTLDAQTVGEILSDDTGVSLVSDEDLTVVTTAVDAMQTIKQTVESAEEPINLENELAKIVKAQAEAIDSVSPDAPVLELTPESDGGVKDDALTNNASPSVRISFDTTKTDGTAVIAGDSIVLLNNGVSIPDASYKLQKSDIKAGFFIAQLTDLSSDSEITAKIIDIAGNISDISTAISIDTVSLEFTSPDQINNIVENSGSGQVIYTATVDGDDFWKFELSDESDPALEIDSITGQVSLVNDPDFELQDSYEFTINAYDNAGNKSSLSLSMGIDNVDDTAPIITSPKIAENINENTASGYVVYEAIASDDFDISEGVTFSLADEGLGFNIDANTGVVTTNADFEANFEDVQSQSFTVVATDVAGNVGVKTVTVGVANLDEVAPTITSTDTVDSVDENSGAGQVIYVATADDSADISGGVTFSIEDTTEYAGAGFAPAESTVSIPDLVAATQHVYVSSSTKSEDGTQETVVITYNADAGNTGLGLRIHFDSSKLSVASLSDVLPGSIFANSTPTADDSDFDGDVNTDSFIDLGWASLFGGWPGETPANIATVTFDIAEGATGSSAINFSSSSAAAGFAFAGQSHDLAITGEALPVESQLSIDPSTGVVSLSIDPDFEAQDQYSFSVVATDAAGNASEAQSVTLDINNLDEVAPTITSGATATAIDENSDAGQVIYTATAGDSDDISDGFTFSLSGDSDSALSINTANGEVTLADNPDAETKAQYSFAVIATDAAGNASEAQLVTLDINNLDDTAPEITSGETAPAVNENSGAGQVIYTATADDSADVSDDVTFSLADEGLGFDIDANTGVVTTNADFEANFEDAQSQSFTVVATDATGNSSEKAVTFEINDLDEVAAVITSGATAQAITENSGAGQVIYVATADDSADISGGVTFSIEDTTEYAGAGFAPAESTVSIPDLVAATQHVYVSSSTKSEDGTQETVVITYNADAGNTGLGLRIHFDSSKLSVASLSDVLPGSIFANSTPTADDSDFDGDVNTDSFIDLGWASLFGGWPGETPANIATVTFDIAEGATGSSAINFSSSSAAAGFAFAGQSHDLAITGEALPVESQLSIDPSTGVVSLSIDPDFEAQDQYSFSVVATDAAGNASEAQSVTLDINNLDEVAPTITSGATATAIDENSDAGQVIYTATAGDSDDISDGFTFSLSGDSDSALSINTANGEVTLADNPDAETKAQYSFAVIATDAAGNASEAQLVTLDINNLDDTAPEITSGETAPAVNENSGAGQVIYTATADDSADVSDGVTFSFVDTTVYSVSNTDSALSTVESVISIPELAAGTQHVYVSSSTKSEDGTQETVVITYNADAGNTGLGLRIHFDSSKLSVASLSDVLPGSIFANSTPTADDSDFDGDVNTDSFIDLGWASLFGGWPGETPANIATVTFDIAEGATGSSAINFSSSSAAAGFAFAGQSHDLAITGDTDSDIEATVESQLSFDSETGAVTLNVNPDYEAQSGYSFEVIATDAEGYASDTRSVTLDIENLDDTAPTITSGDSVSVFETYVPGDLVYRALVDDTADVSEGVTFRLAEESNADFLAIDSENGDVTLTDVPDFTDNLNYTFTVVADDGVNQSQKVVTLTLVDQDLEAPVFTSSTNVVINENIGENQIIYNAVATDELVVSFDLSEDSDAALSINSATGAVTLATNPDHETQSEYSFTVIATDTASNFSEQAFTVSVNDLDDAAPTITSADTAASIDENSGSGQVIYTVTADDSGDDVTATPITYSLTEDSDAGLSINASTGAVSLIANPDHESQSEYSFAVIATDAAGNSSEAQSVTLNINDLDDTAPEITSGETAAAVDENSGANQVIYTATADDSVDVTDGVTFRLSEDSDVALSIDSATGAVTLATNPDHETQSQYSFSVIATDAAGNESAPQAVTLEINDLDDADPVITSSDTATALDENSGAAQVIYTATADDSADISGGVTFSLSEDSDAALSIDSATGAVTLSDDPDAETQSQYTFTVVATDAAGNSSEQAVALNINNLDEVAPTITSGATAATIDENSGASQVVYTATADDSSDVSDGVTYSLSVDSDSALSIDAVSGEVTLSTNPDHETQSQYSFSVIATDAAGNSSDQAVTLNINNLDEVAPTITSGDTADAIVENSGAGQVIYTATADDSADISGGVTFSLSEDSDAALSIDSVTGEVTLATDPVYYYQNEYEFSVLSVDAAGNISTLQPVSLQINEIIPPEASVSLETDTGVSADNISSVVKILVSNIKLGATWEYSLDGGITWAAGDNGAPRADDNKVLSFDIDVDGSYEVNVRQTNTAGTTAMSESVPFTLDTLPPIVEFVSADSEAGTISVNYNESLDPAFSPNASDYDITQNGNSLTINNLSVIDNVLVLSITESFNPGALNFTYSASTDANEQVTDLAGNKLDQGFTQMIVSDGYIRGAQVYVDVNGDGIADENELREEVTSDAFGQIILSDEFLNAPENIDENGNPYSVIVKGGVNMDSGAPNEIELTAPAGYSVINPLSTLVSEIASSDEFSGLTPEEAAIAAETSLAVSLGIEVGEGGLGSYDPQSDDNVANRVVATQIATVLAVASSTESTGSEGAETAALSSLASTITSAKGTVTLDSSTISSVLSEVIEDADALDKISTAVDEMEAVKASDDVESAFAAIVLAQAKAIDSIAPEAPESSLSSQSDTGVLGDEMTKQDSPTVRVSFETQLLDGTAAVAGDKLEIYSNGVVNGSYVLTEEDISLGYKDHEISALADGEHYISAKLTDITGNQSYVTTNIIEVDTIKPEITSADSAANIDENSGADQVIYTATADNLSYANGQVAFSFSEDSDVALSIDSTTGAVTLSDDPDFEVQSQYTFSVIATDAAGNASDAQLVTLDINNLDDTAPEITSGATATAINENSGAGQVIYTATADDSADISGGVTFSLEDEGLGFSIDSNSGVVTTNADFAADYEDAQSQSFTVVATDAAGNASESQLVTLDINNLDEVAPIITSEDTAIAIGENSGAGQVIYTATADDSADISGGVIFSLSEDSDAALSIDASTGEVTLATDPDFEGQSQYTFSVIATDAAGNASEAQLISLDINNLDDTAPEITSGETATAIDENSGAGQVIFTATADDSADISGGVTFSLSEDSDAALLIDSTTGAVTLSDDPDFEVQSQYTFSVIATDAAGNASDAQLVTLDINNLDDTAPEITSGATATAIDENSGAGQVIYTATADDSADISGGVTFSLADEDLGFSIDAISGEVTTNADFAADFEDSQSQSFTVVATDAAGNLGEVQLVTLDINNLDEVAPIIISEDTAIAIGENSGAGQVIYTATADDSADISGGVIFSLSQDSDAALSIDASTGEVTLATDPDFEGQGQYTFSVIATDAAGNASEPKTVTLDINPIDDTSPVITSDLDVSLFDSSNSVIYQVTASDIDSPDETIAYSFSPQSVYQDPALPAGAFEQIYTANQDGSYTLELFLDDSVIADYSAGLPFYDYRVNYNPLEVSDVELLLPTAYTSTVNDNLPGQISVATVHFPDKFDIQSGPIAQINFNLQSGVYSAEFEITNILLPNNATPENAIDTVTGNDSTARYLGNDGLSFNEATGEVSLPDAPDALAQPVYSFTVTATDVAGNSTSELVTVLIDGAPVITSTNQPDGIDENSGSDQVVYTAISNKPDVTTFTLSEDSDDGLSIDASTGAVTLADNPDFETQEQYSFTVIATDDEDRSSSKVVTVAVNNLDEVAATFSQPTVTETIDENIGVGQVVFTASADDSGDVSNGVTYNLNDVRLDGVLTSDLSINAVTGEVTLASNPDHESGEQYTFIVGASDGIHAPVALQTVTLDVNDLDDAAPTITSGSTAVAIDENSGASQVIYTATSTDLGDDVSDTPIAYSLAEGSDAALSIDSVTGEVVLAIDPDHETQSQYSFAVIATDAAGNASEAQSVTLDINDLDDTAPTVTSGVTAEAIDENSGAAQVIYTATADDSADTSDGFTFSLSEDSNVGLSIDASTGEVTLATNPDHETQSQYSFAVIATDAAGNASEAQSVTLDINNLDEAAPIITSAAETVVVDTDETNPVIYTATADDSADISGGVSFSLNDTTAYASTDSGSAESTVSIPELAAATQHVYVSSSTKSEDGTQETVVVSYNADDTTTTGLGLRIHFDSSALSASDIATLMTNDLLVNAVVESDDNDLDGDASTDTYVQFGWASLFGQWPNAAPADLASITFDIAEGATGSSGINFTASSNAAGFAFDGQNHEVAITGEAAPVASQLSIDSATGEVTLSGELDPATQSEYSFTVTATDTAGNSSDLDVVVDAEQPMVNAAIVVVVDGESPSAPIYQASANIDNVSYQITDLTQYPDTSSGSGSAESQISIPQLAAATQHVYVSSSTKSEDGTQETVVVSYNADDTTTTGLGLRIHFDSSVLSASDITTLMTNDLLVNAVVESDDSDFDGDASTDTYVQFGWASLFGQWPNAAPADLASITFDIAEGATGSSAINFSISSNAAGFAFDGQDHNLVLAAEAVVPAAELVIDNAAGTVSLDAAANSDVMADYSFRVEGTDADGDAIGSQTVPVVVVDQIVNADASSYTGSADEDVFALADGSAEITSGAGEDEFILDPAFASATHTITDFESGVDTIHISEALLAAGYNNSDNAPTQLASAEMSADILDLVNGDDSSLDNLFGATYDEDSNTLTVFADSDSSAGSTDMESFQITLDDSATVEDDDIVADLSAFIA